MHISIRALIFVLIGILALLSLTSCGKKCDAGDTEKVLYNTDNCTVENESVSSISDNYSIYVSSGFPVASGVGIVSRWNQQGKLINIVRDYAGNPGFMPQTVVFQSLTSGMKMLLLAFNGTVGEVDIADPDGSNFSQYFQNSTAMAAGTRRLTATTDGGYLITRTAGVERFNSAKQRVGAAARYLTGGGCTITAGTAAVQLMLSGSEYVIASNGATSPNNKVNLYNGATGGCISGVALAGPATTMWPVDMIYITEENKLLVLYYPFTASTTNAQIWSFDVTPTAINNATLLFNDTSGDIATVSATPGSLSSSLAYYRTTSERFVLVGTNFRSVIKLNYDGSTLSKAATTPLIFQSSFVKAISNVTVVGN